MGITKRINSNTIFTKYLVSEGVFSSDNLFLLDVGASGGIDQHWNIFVPDLRAIGFEPFINEVKRLNKICLNPKIRFHSYFVESKEGIITNHESQVKNNNFFERSSAAHAAKLLNDGGYAQKYYDPSGNKEVTTKHITLDDFVEQNDNLNVDFIKTDTDGFDYYPEFDLIFPHYNFTASKII